ncbi:MmgE/PrpD family protein [Pseudonocardia ailaonensis]|uniref:MmgE/PrpD family protein n=1 Tax=Pseudonocardia ailaonensis TaxID=367279 RepID=A0ABN2N5R3_9PSEU
MTQTPLTSRFVDFAGALDLREVPDEAVRAAKSAILDWLGVTLAGSAEPLAGALLAARAGDRGGPSTVVGAGRTASPETAALVNGACAHALDFDDYLAEGVIHGTAPLVAALLAVAEDRGRTGADLLAAFVAGYEVHAHLSTVLGQPLIHRGYHPTGVLTHLGTAIGVGRLIGLGPELLATCLGLAGTQAAGLLASFGTMGKPLHSGKAAADAVLSASLAEAGYTGSTSVLDGERGLPVVLTGIDDEQLGAELGTRWLVADNAIKPYAACGAIHASIDAAIRLSRVVDPARIDRVRCDVSAVTVRAAAIPRPATGLEAKFSTQYAVASALLSGTSPASHFTDGATGRADVRALTERVDLVSTYERITRARVEVTQTDGTRHEDTVDWAKGSPGNPMTGDDTARKFLDLAANRIGPSVAAEVVAFVEGLEKQSDLRDLAALVRGSEPARADG